MSERALLYTLLTVCVVNLAVSVILAQHLNEVADNADKASAGLLSNQKVQSVLSGVAGLFGGGK